VIRWGLAAMLAALPAIAGAAAGVPSPPNSILPNGIRVVGRDGAGAVDPSGAFTVTVRDLANNPRAGVVVRVEFRDCANVRLCSQQGPGVTAMSCGPGNPWVEGITGADGTWTATVLGCSAGTPAEATSGCASIYAESVLQGYCIVTTLDLAGCDGANAADLSAWLADFFSGEARQRGDFDYSGSLGANDLSVWIRAFVGARSVRNCGAAACP
jgi:hypothetical protein